MAKKTDWGHKGYFVFRVLIGLMFVMHGAQKFGFLGGEKKELMSMMGAAGVLELVIGLAVLLGVYVTYAAILGAIEMLVAYVMIHAPQGWNPLLNQGEPALLYVAAFLVLAHHGAGKWNCEHLLKK